MKFNQLQRAFIVIWIAFGLYWLASFFRPHSTESSTFGLVTAALGIFTVVIQARKGIP